MSNLLKKSFAPIDGSAWEELEAEARQVLETNLTARRCVDFDGPHGWDYAAVNLGRVTVEKNSPYEGVQWGIRQVLPMVEIRVPFVLQKMELDNIGRGAKNPELDNLQKAAHNAALFEDSAIYKGFERAGIKGLLTEPQQKPVPLDDDPSSYPGIVASGIRELATARIGGPYALVLSWNDYPKVTSTRSQGMTVREHLEKITGSKVYFSHALDAGLLMSKRGGDFTVHVGVDFSLGFHTENKESLEFFLTESFTVQINSPEAVVPLKR